MAQLHTRRFHGPLGALPTAWQGRVEQVHGSSAVARRPEDGWLLTVLAWHRPLAPWSVALPDGIALPAQGDTLVVAGRVVRWPGCRLALSGPGASLGLPMPAPPLDPEVLGRHLGALPTDRRTRALLEPDGACAGLDQRVTRRAGNGLDRLCRCLAEDEPAGPDLSAAVSALIGLGPGLTPTGDDLVVGVAAAAGRLAGAGCLGQERLDRLNHVLAALPADATTPVGRQMLGLAAQGWFPEPLPCLLAALGDGRTGPATVRALAAAVEGLGSWSGCDMLAGALALSRQWLRARGGTWQ